MTTGQPEKNIFFPGCENWFTGQLCKVGYPVEYHVIGAGIAGLSAAYALVGGGRKIHIYEKEALPCMHSSSRNAAIFRTYEADPVLSILTKKSYLEFANLETHAGPLIDRRGLLIDPVELDYYEDSFIENYFGKKNPAMAGLKGRPGALQIGNEYIFKGTFLEHNGVIDIHALQDFLVRSLARRGVTFHYGMPVEKLEIRQGRVVNIIASPDVCHAVADNAIVVNAAGAWAQKLMSASGAWSAPVVPYKRHLFFLRSPLKLEFSGLKEFPVVWNEKRDVYLRPEGDGFLATHCDQREVEPGDYACDEKEVPRFLHSILSVFPFLKDFHISRYWACLRTFSLDQVPVVGWDPFVDNVFWVAGLGGRGMTISPGLVGEIRQLVDERQVSTRGEVFNPYSPGRFS